MGAVALSLSVASVMFYQITGNSKMSQPALQDPTGMFWVSDTSSLLLTIYLDQISGQNLECLSLNICCLLKGPIIVYKS